MAATGSSSHRPSSAKAILQIASRMIGPRDGNRGGVLAGATLEIAGIVLGVAGPYALKLLIDDLAAGATPRAIIACVLVFVVSWAGAAILANWRMVYSTRVIDRITAGLVEAMSRDRLPAAALGRDSDSAATLGLIERLPYSLAIIVDGLIWRTIPLCIQLLITLLIVAGTIPLHYALVLGATMVGYAVATWFAAGSYQACAANLNAASGQVSQLTGDIFRNARRVVLNGALDTEIALVRAAHGDKAVANRRLIWALVRSSLLQYGVMSVGLMVLLILSGLDALDHVITPGAFILLQTYAFRLILPVSGLGYILSQSATALANVRDVLDLVGEVDAGPTASLAPAGPAAISLRDVDFSYGPGHPGVTDITLDIQPGTFTVIVGANGSGKSTLAQLMAGLLAPASGTVRVGGADLASVPATARHQVALYVPQFIGLFNRSIAANALYPPTRHTEADLLQLLETWQFHEPGRTLDLAGIVGEQGEKLSGGQIQKLELARVTGIDVPVIILDESTSALDPVAEESVLATLRERFDGRTTLVMITHRQGVAEKADQVLFMRSGRLLRHGPHSQLIRDSGTYAALWAGRSD